MSDYPLTEANMGLAHAAVDRLVQKFGLKKADCDDLLQVAWQTMCRMERTYDPSRGTFNTHVYLAVQRDLVEYIRRDTGIPIPRSTSHKNGLPIRVRVLNYGQYNEPEGLRVLSRLVAPPHCDCTDKQDAVKALALLDYDEMRVFVADSQDKSFKWMERVFKMSRRTIVARLASAEKKIEAWRESL